MKNNFSIKVSLWCKARGNISQLMFDGSSVRKQVTNGKSQTFVERERERECVCVCVCLRL